MDDFQSVLRMADEFIKKCSLLVGSDANYSSPLRLCIVQQSARFIKSFHQERKAKLGFLFIMQFMCSDLIIAKLHFILRYMFSA